MSKFLRPLSWPVQRATPQLAATAGAFARGRRAILVAGALVCAGLVLPCSPASAEQRAADTSQQWVGTWGAAPVGPPLPAHTLSFTDQTLRLIVHTTIGGPRVRIRLSNEFGTTPLRINAAHVALRQGGASIVPDTDRVLTFSGMQGITIPPGAPALSDPVALDVPALSDLAVSLHLPGTVQASTLHYLGFQTNYVSPPGNFTGAATLPTARTITSWPFLTGVDVLAPGKVAIVAFGDSITDGANTVLDANHRWPDLLALRLKAARDAVDGKGKEAPGAVVAIGDQLGIVNRGTSGARLLRDAGEQPLFGRSALERFDRDVLASAGVRYMVVLIGINDIGHPGTGSIPASDTPTLEQMIAGYRQLIARAHAKGILAYGATLTPFEGTVFPGYFSLEKEKLRQAVNQWIRSSGEFDAVLDFDGAVRDPGHPTRMLAGYDSGDHLHPNDKGMQAMANAIPLELFVSQSSAPGRIK
jgi:lysophospholipase L1-like esterase